MNLKKLLSQPQYDPIRDKKAERNLFARRALVSFIGVLALSAIFFASSARDSVSISSFTSSLASLNLATTSAASSEIAAYTRADLRS